MSATTSTVLKAFLLALAAGTAFAPSAEAQRFQWIHGTDRNEQAYDIEYTFDGGYITAGRRDGFFDATGADPSDYHIIKTDPLGAPVWSTQFGGFARDEAHSIMPTDDDGYIVAGQTASNGPDLGLGLLKLGPFGGPVWAFTYLADVGFEIPNLLDPEDSPQVSVRETRSRDIVAVANIASSFPGGPPVGAGIYLRTNPGGVLLAQIIFSLPTFVEQGQLTFTDIKELPDETLVISGYVTRSDPAAGAPADVDAFVMRIDAFGAILWANRYFEAMPSAMSGEQGYGLDVGPNGDFLVMSGVSNRSGGDLDGFHTWIDTATGGVLRSNTIKDFAPAWAATRLSPFNLEATTAGEYPPALAGGSTTGVGAAVNFDFSGAPNWFSTYGPITPLLDDRLEAVTPAIETCGWGFAGSKELNVFGGRDVHLVKVNDAGVSGCFEDQFDPGIEEVLFRQLSVELNRFFIDGQEPWGDIQQVQTPAEPLCVDDNCEDPSPCRPDITTDGANPGDPGYGVPDGAVTVADLTYFVEQWIANNAAVADVTTDGTNPGDPGFGVPDGLVTVADLTFFVELWIRGCP